MKKIKKLFSILSLCLVTSLASNGSIVLANTNNEKNYDRQTKELIEKFPSFKESLEKYTTGELVSSEEVYIRYTPKTEELKKEYKTTEEVNKDFIVEEFTREEYEIESKKEELKEVIRGIGSQETTPSSWIRVDLQVYYGDPSIQSDYMAYNFSSWLKDPYLRLTDAIGISLSNGLIISGNASTRAAEYHYYDPYYPGGDRVERLVVKANNEGKNGVLATFNLDNGNPSSTLYHNAMIQTGVNFVGSGYNQGWINGHYVHKELGFGDISIGTDGRPSISAGTKYDQHQSSIHVSR